MLLSCTIPFYVVFAGLSIPNLAMLLFNLYLSAVFFAPLAIAMQCDYLGYLRL